MTNVSTENNNNNLSVTKKIVLVSDDESFIEFITAFDKQNIYEVIVANEVSVIEIINAHEVVPELTIFDLAWLEKSVKHGLSISQFKTPMLLVVDTFESDFLQGLLKTDVFQCVLKRSSFAQWHHQLEWSMHIQSKLKDASIQALQLQNALKQERDINVAIGVAMVEWRVGRKESFERLRKQARDSRQKMSKICRDYLDGYEAKLQHSQREMLARREKVN